MPCIESGCEMCEDAGEPCVHCLRGALVQAEEALQRAQTWSGLLRQYDEGLPTLITRARQKANQVLAFGQEDGS